MGLAKLAAACSGGDRHVGGRQHFSKAIESGRRGVCNPERLKDKPAELATRLTVTHLSKMHKTQQHLGGGLVTVQVAALLRDERPRTSLDYIASAWPNFPSHIREAIVALVVAAILSQRLQSVEMRPLM